MFIVHEKKFYEEFYKKIVYIYTNFVIFIHKFCISCKLIYCIKTVAFYPFYLSFALQKGLRNCQQAVPI